MKRKTLENGLRIVVVELPHLHSVEIGIHFGTGSIDDPADKKGIAHAVEHLLFRGTSLCPDAEILDAAFEVIGGGANAGTDEETTCYYSRVHPKHTDRGMALISSMILSHLMKDWEIEKKSIIQEIRDGLNNKQENICPIEVVNTLLWPGTDLSIPVIGDIRSVRGIKLKDAKAFIADNYTPDNAVLCVAGKVKAEDIFASAEKYFSARKGKRAPKIQIPDLPVQTGAKLSFVRNPDSQFSVCIGFRGFSRHHDLSPVASLLKFSFCQSSGRLFSQVRGRKGLVYHIDADTSVFPSTGAFYVNFETEPNNLSDALSESVKILWALAEKPMDEEELARHKESFIYELEYSQDSSQQIQMRYGSGEILGHMRTIEDDKVVISGITAEMVQMTAKLLFHPQNLHIAIIGPVQKKTKTEIEGLIANFNWGLKEEMRNRTRSG
ncbi:MAG: Peptidase M16 protein, partial [uncultured bacterium (gcode 4)]